MSGNMKMQEYGVTSQGCYTVFFSYTGGTSGDVPSEILCQRKISSLLFAAAMEYNSDIAPVISDAPKELTKGETQL